jgi:hypothetical protein
MSFPVSPLDGQSAVVNNILYTYNATYNTWTRVPGTTVLGGVSNTTGAIIWNTANSAGVFANGAFAQANVGVAGFAYANTLGTTVTSHTNSINSIFPTTNAAFAQANSSYTLANSAFAAANAAGSNATVTAAYGQANTATTLATAAYNQANTATTNAATADAKAVNAGAYANGAFTLANTTNTLATNAASYANGAFALSNTNSTSITLTGAYANGAFERANAAYAAANSTSGGSGGVTASQFLVKGTLSGNQSLNNGTDTVINFDTKQFDPQNWFNTTSHTVTPTIAGYYKVTYSAWFTQGTSSAGAQYNIQIHKSSTSGGTTVIAQQPIIGNNAQSLTVSDTVYLNGSSDYLAFTAYSSIAGQSLQYTNGTYFTVELIGVSGAANVAFNQANNAAVFANGAFTQANAAYTYATNAGNYANSAYTKANSALASTGGTISGDLTVTGNLIVSGGASYVNTATYQTVDSLIELAANNTGDAVDIGFYGQVNTNTYTGLVKQAGTNNFLLFKGLPNPTNNTLPTGSATAANVATLIANVQAYSVTIGGVDALGYTTTAFTRANSAYDTANSAGILATAAYGQANTATTNAATADAKAVNAGTFANGAFAAANTAGTNAITAGLFANAAFAAANSGSSATSAFNQANAAFAKANSALANTSGTIFGGDLTVSGNLTALSTLSSNTFFANTIISPVSSNTVIIANNYSTVFDTLGGVTIQGGKNSTSNTTGSLVISSGGLGLSGNLYSGNHVITGAGNGITFVDGTTLTTSPTSSITNVGVYANGAYNQANSSLTYATNAGNYANAAYTQANSAYTYATNAGNYANGAFNQANSAYGQANTGTTLATAAYGQANTNYTIAVAGFNMANSAMAYAINAGNYANGSFYTANTAYNNGITVGTYANASFIRANSAFDTANLVGSYANSAYTLANTSASTLTLTQSYANSAFAAANAAGSSAMVTSAYGQANASFTQANSAYILANAAFAKANTGGSAGTDDWARLQANAAFTQANAAYTLAASGGGGGGGSASIGVNLDKFTANGSPSFTLSVTPSSANNIIVNLDGLEQLDSSYSLVGNILTLSQTPVTGTKVDVRTFSTNTIVANAAFTQANAAFSQANTKTSLGKSIAMTIVFGG